MPFRFCLAVGVQRYLVENSEKSQTGGRTRVMPNNPNRIGITDLAFYAAVGVILLLIVHGATGLDLPGSSSSSSSWLGDTEGIRASVHSLTGVLVGALMSELHGLHGSFLTAIGL